MRHEKIIAAEELARLDISAASWPATTMLAVLPVVELEGSSRSDGQSAPAAARMPVFLTLAILATGVAAAILL